MLVAVAVQQHKRGHVAWQLVCVAQAVLESSLNWKYAETSHI